MRTIPALLTTMLALMFLLPPAVADETVTYEYTAAPSVSLGGQGLGLYPCPSGCDLDGDGTNDYPLDHGPWSIPAGHTNVIISASDLVHGANVGLFACWFNPDGDQICDDDDFRGGPSCGTLALLSSPFGGGSLQIHIISLLVEEDFDVCGATKGTITVSSH